MPLDKDGVIVKSVVSTELDDDDRIEETIASSPDVSLDDHSVEATGEALTSSPTDDGVKVAEGPDASNEVVSLVDDSRTLITSMEVNTTAISNQQTLTVLCGVKTDKLCKSEVLL